MDQERAHQTIDTGWTPLYLCRITFIAKLLAPVLTIAVGGLDTAGSYGSIVTVQ